MPIVLQVDRSGLVGEILEQLRAEPKNFMLKFDQPWTVGLLRAELEGNEYVGMGNAKVCHPDTWSEGKGKKLVVMRAARQIADEFIADLRKKEQELNDMANDLGMRVMECIADKDGYITRDNFDEVTDLLESLIPNHEEEE